MRAKLLDQFVAKNQKFFIQYGGQGVPYLMEIAKFKKTEESLKSFFDFTFKTLKEIENEMGGKSNPLIEQGLDLQSWIENIKSAPPQKYLFRVSISGPMIFILQTINYLLFTNRGYPVSETLGVTAGVTGHSQGMLSAILFSLGGEGEQFYQHYYKLLKYISYMGYRAQEAYPNFEISPELVAEFEKAGISSPSPMAACIGYRREELMEKVETFNKERAYSDTNKIYISLYNTYQSMVLSAKPLSLLEFYKEYQAEMKSKNFQFVFLKTTAPFHSVLLKSGWDKLKLDAEKMGFHYKGSDLKVPVYSIHGGKNLQTFPVLAEKLFFDMVVNTLYWDNAIKYAFEDSSVEAIIDFGPGQAIARSSAELLAKNGAVSKKVLSLANPTDWKVLFE
ncbi:MAG: ACP S-malonyltransferase [Leptospiraceae bacterium]|nr:ACP S-malonyltransferase [Leptospiraceae bacterium]MCP5497595.1 ACP S-malonyltransferase [Leptospiraceae bacterium]